jgi:hypothetical protein
MTVLVMGSTRPGLTRRTPPRGGNYHLVETPSSPPFDVAVYSSRHVDKYLKILDENFQQHYAEKKKGNREKTP